MCVCGVTPVRLCADVSVFAAEFTGGAEGTCVCTVSRIRAAAAADGGDSGASAASGESGGPRAAICSELHPTAAAAGASAAAEHQRRLQRILQVRRRRCMEMCVKP